MIVAAPKLTPVTVGGEKGVVAPCGIKILLGEIVTLDVSLLVRVTKTPLASAGVAKVTWNGAN